MADTRTNMQIEADKLDELMFRLVGRMDEFAKTTKSKELERAASRLHFSRDLVRKHMHQNDRTATAASTGE